jgi:two-component system sensor histidine kinase UhpB
MNGKETGDRLEAARLAERRRIARDVHDELGGDLAAIKMALAVLKRRMPPDEAAREQLAYIDKLVDGAIDSMHRVAEKWQGFADGALHEIFQRQIDEFSRQSGIACKSELAEAALDADRAAALHHILRECLTNIGKHAQAGCVSVCLRLTDEGVTLDVEDDGAGFVGTYSGARVGLGIRGMQQRAEELGGVFSIHRAAPRGTLVTVELPLGNRRT